MCTFKTDREVTLCEVAIENVRAQVSAGLDSPIRVMVVDGRGTPVGAGADLDAHLLSGQPVRTGIADADGGPTRERARRVDEER